MIYNVPRIIKHKSFKIFYTTILILSLVWGMSSIATDDISSAHNNFSASGIISNISEDEISIEQANGSDKTNDSSYDLNVKYLEKVETSEYIALRLSNLKVGDKIIVQGLTNGSSFFIKRIISFSTNPEDIEKDAEDLIMASSTATTTEDITSDIIDDATSISTATSTTDTVLEDIATTTTSTTTEDIATTSISTSTASTTGDVTDSVIDNVVDTAQDIIDSITDAVGDIVDTIVDAITSTASTTPEIIDTESTITPEPITENIIEEATIISE